MNNAMGLEDDYGPVGLEDQHQLIYDKNKDSRLAPSPGIITFDNGMVAISDIVSEGAQAIKWIYMNAAGAPRVEFISFNSIVQNGRNHFGSGVDPDQIDPGYFVTKRLHPWIDEELKTRPNGFEIYIEARVILGGKYQPVVGSPQSPPRIIIIRAK